MTKRIDRRAFVRSALTAGAGLLLAPTAGWSAAQRARLTGEGAFAQGVASGEPATNAITLWTRLEGLTASGNVGFEVARDPGFARVVSSGTAVADAAATSPSTSASAAPSSPRRGVLLPLQNRVGLVAGGALPHRPAGRLGARRCASPSSPARSSSPASTPPIATSPRRTSTSSSAWATTSTSRPSRRRARPTHRSARRLRRRRRGADAGRVPAQVLALPHRREPARGPPPVRPGRRVGRPRGRGQLRRRPAGRRDAEPPRALRRAPLQRLPRVVRAHAAPARGGRSNLRLAAAGQRRAVPARHAPVPRRPALQPHRRALSAPCPPTTTDDPSRTLLGAEQKAWLKGALRASRARWKVIANQVMICSLDAPPRNPLNTDSWDGYGAERQELVRPHRLEGDRRRHLRDRRHPHLLRRRRHAHRPPVRPR